MTLFSPCHNKNKKKNKKKNPHLNFHIREGTRGLKFGTRIKGRGQKKNWIFLQNFLERGGGRPKNFSIKNFFQPNFFFTKNFFGPKLFGLKFFWTKNFFGPKILLDRTKKKFWPKILTKFFGDQNFFWSDSLFIFVVPILIPMVLCVYLCVIVYLSLFCTVY